MTELSSQARMMKWFVQAQHKEAPKELITPIAIAEHYVSKSANHFDIYNKDMMEINQQSGSIQDYLRQFSESKSLSQPLLLYGPKFEKTSEEVKVNDEIKNKLNPQMVDIKQQRLAMIEAIKPQKDKKAMPDLLKMIKSITSKGKQISNDIEKQLVNVKKLAKRVNQLLDEITQTAASVGIKEKPTMPPTERKTF